MVTREQEGGLGGTQKGAELAQGHPTSQQSRGGPLAVAAVRKSVVSGERAVSLQSRGWGWREGLPVMGSADVSERQGNEGSGSRVLTGGASPCRKWTQVPRGSVFS